MVWKRPSFWTCIVAIIAFWDWRALNGKWVYDDAGSVLKNVVVTGMVPWKEAFKRDFWGQEMKEAGSHKSFRPITTLSLKLNYVYETSRPAFIASGEKTPPTFSFHLVNVLLHGLVTGLITEATWYVLPDVVSQLIVGGLFGIHPVHAEVVSNITSRGELLMAFFFGVAFLSFAKSLREAVENENPSNSARSKGSRFGRFLVRASVLAIETLVVVAWRYVLNGETSPDFIEAQNPAGFAKDRFTRAFSVSWVYCLYIRDALYPYYLCPDWSGVSLDLITSLSDPRAMIVFSLWYGAAMSFWSLIVVRHR